MLPGEPYETLVVFVVNFVLKMFKIIDFYIKNKMHARRTRFFSRARMYSSSSACMTKSSFNTETIV